MKSRIVGLLLIAAGLACGWFFILGPLHQAQAHAPEVSYNLKSFILAPLLVVGGIALLLGGPPVAEAFVGKPEGRQQIAITVVTALIAFALSGLGWWWFDGQMTALGYGP